MQLKIATLAIAIALAGTTAQASSLTAAQAHVPVAHNTAIQKVWFDDDSDYRRPYYKSYSYSRRYYYRENRDDRGYDNGYRRSYHRPYSYDRYEDSYRPHCYRERSYWSD